jgi:thiol reductant ABC exporter CydD subunit
VTFDRRLFQQAQPTQTALMPTVGLGLLAGVVLIGQAFYLSRIINRVFLEGQSLADVHSLLLLLFGLSLVRAALIWGSQVAAQRVAGRVKSDLRQRLSAHLMTLGPAYAQTERSGELTNTLTEGVEALDAYFSQYLPQLALAVLIPLAILVFVFPLDFTSGLVLLLTAPLIPLFMILIGSLAQELTQRQWVSLSRLSAHFLDVLQGLTTLKLLGRSREQAAVIAIISDRFRQTTMGVLRVAFLSALVLELIATLGTAVVAVEIGLRLLYGYLAFEQAFFVLLLAPEFYLPLRLLGTRFHAGTAGVTAARRIFEILDTPLLTTTDDHRPQTAEDSRREFDFPANTVIKKAAQSLSGLTIRFADVHYAYADGQRPALKGVSFTVKPGQKIALVGPSGAGKSTIAHLLLGFIAPTHGLITVDGVPLTELNMATWRAHLAWVPQQPYLFHVSVGDNIQLARPEATPEQVIRAARQAQAHDFIEALPQGYDTIIGERGARLSGGQAQRLALARAFLKDVPFLILDEATANLDPLHEIQIQAALQELMQGRSSLIIAHRLNTIYTADKILVMAGGQVVETGSHASLVQQPGLYRRLVTAYGGAG